MLRFSLIYGSASLVLAPLLGTWLTRLIGYAWPIFFVALPLLFDAVPRRNLKPSQEFAALGFFATHMLVFSIAYRFAWLTQLGLNLVLWAVGFFLLRYWLLAPDQPSKIAIEAMPA